MTAATPAPSTAAASAAPQASGLTKDTLTALAAALAAENGAVWAYGVVAANMPNSATLIATVQSGHLARRDATATLITQGGGKVSPPAAAYSLPVTVTNAATAQALATVLETDCTAAWYAVVGNTDRSDLRGYALAGMSDSAVWMAQLKLANKVNPPTVAFPGRPS